MPFGDYQALDDKSTYCLSLINPELSIENEEKLNILTAPAKAAPLIPCKPMNGLSAAHAFPPHLSFTTVPTPIFGFPMNFRAAKVIDRYKLSLTFLSFVPNSLNLG